MIIEIAGGEGQNYESRELLKSVKDLDDAVVSVREDVEDVKDAVDELNSNSDDLAYGENAGGKNLFKDRNVSGTRYTRIDCNLPAGTYTLSCRVNSSDTDANESRVFVRDKDDVALQVLSFERGARNSQTFTVTFDIGHLYFYASTNFQTSADDTFTYSDIQIEKGSSATDYEPFIMSNKQLTDNVDNLKSDLIKNKEFQISSKTLTANTWTTVVPASELPTVTYSKIINIMCNWITVSANDNYNILFRVHATNGIQAKVSTSQDYTMNLNFIYFGM